MISDRLDIYININWLSLMSIVNDDSNCLFNLFVSVCITTVIRCFPLYTTEMILHALQMKQSDVERDMSIIYVCHTHAG